jgi:outer membrane lipoprotein LolB
LDSTELTGQFGVSNQVNQINQIKLVLSNGKVLTSNSVQSLMQQQLGWSVPIIYLVSWVKGIPAQNQIANYKLNKYGLLGELSQNNWQIKYSNYVLGQNKLPYAKVISLKDKQFKLNLNVSSLVFGL